MGSGPPARSPAIPSLSMPQKSPPVIASTPSFQSHPSPPFNSKRASSSSFPKPPNTTSPSNVLLKARRSSASGPMAKSSKPNSKPLSLNLLAVFPRPKSTSARTSLLWSNSTPNPLEHFSRSPHPKANGPQTPSPSSSVTAASSTKSVRSDPSPVVPKSTTANHTPQSSSPAPTPPNSGSTAK